MSDIVLANDKPKVASLFAGIGGFDLAFEFAGWQTTALVEVDKACQSVLTTRFPLARIFSDIREVKGTDLGNPDCITAGVPCQDVSIAGRREGLAGARTGLFFEFSRLLDETQTEWFVFENVPGLMSSNKGRDFGTILGTLDELGYGIAWSVLDAQNWGLAQRRKRLFIVGRLGDVWGPSQVLLEPEGSSGDPPPRRTARQAAPSVPSRGADHVGGAGNGRPIAPLDVVRALTANGVGTCGADDNQAQAGHLIPILEVGARTGASTDDIRAGIGIGDENDPMYTLQATKQHGVAYTDPEAELAGPLGGGAYLTGRRTEDDPNLVYGLHNQTGEALDVAPTVDARARNGPIQEQQGVVVAHLMRMREGKDGGGKGPLISEEMSLTLATGNDQILAVTEQVPTEKDVRGYDFVQVTSWANRSNPKEGDPFPTLAAMSEPHAVMRTVVRRLTPGECEKLQGFPSGWTEVVRLEDGTLDTAKDSARYKQLGNAVAVPVARWIGDRILEQIEQE